MKPFGRNPRKITNTEQEQLKKSLLKLGDLSGIVHNLETDEVVGGNQRSEVINVNNCKVEITHTFEKPDEQGTVGLGFILWKGKQYESK